MKLLLTADKVLMRGPKIDGSYVISFEVGEYEKPNVAKLLELDTEQVVNLTIEQGDENSDDLQRK